LFISKEECPLESIQRLGGGGLDLRTIPGFDENDRRFTVQELRDSRFHPLLAGNALSIVCAALVLGFLSAEMGCDIRKGAKQVLAHASGHAE